MGTTRYAAGEIVFDPPLQADELRRPELTPFLDGSRAVRLAVFEQAPVETAEGTVVRRTCDVIVPSHDSDDICTGHYILSNLPDHLAELVALINGIVHPEHGARSFGRKHIEVYRDASCVDDFEAYQLRVHPTGSGRVPDPPAVHRIDAKVMWQDCSPQLVPNPNRK